MLKSASPFFPLLTFPWLWDAPVLDLGPSRSPKIYITDLCFWKTLVKTIILLFYPRAGFNNSKLGARVWLVAKFWFSLPKHWAIKRSHIKWSKSFAWSKWSQRWFGLWQLWQLYGIKSLGGHTGTNIFYKFVILCLYKGRSKYNSGDYTDIREITKEWVLELQHNIIRF